MSAVYECQVTEALRPEPWEPWRPVLSPGQSDWVVALPPVDGWGVPLSMVYVRGACMLGDDLPTIEWADQDVLVNAGLLSAVEAPTWPPNRWCSVEELRRRENNY